MVESPHAADKGSSKYGLLFFIGAGLALISGFLLFTGGALMDDRTAPDLRFKLFVGAIASVVAGVVFPLSGMWMHKNSGPAFMIWILLVMTFAPTIALSIAFLVN